MVEEWVHRGINQKQVLVFVFTIFRQLNKSFSFICCSSTIHVENTLFLLCDGNNIGIGCCFGYKVFQVFLELIPDS
jgi:hypothetical protein